MDFPYGSTLPSTAASSSSNKVGNYSYLQHIAHVHYTASERERGQMDGVRIEGHSFRDNLKRESHQVAMELDHPNHLRPFLIDNERQMMLYHASDMTVEQYLERLPRPFEMYTIPGTNRWGLFLNGHYKEIIKAAISFISYLHSVGKCLDVFSKENIVFRGRVLKFVNVTTLDCTQALVELDYSCLATIIRDVILHGQCLDNYPHNLRDFVKLLDGKPRWPRTEEDMKSRIYLLQNHIALMSTQEQANFLTRSWNSYMWIKHSKYIDQYEDAIHMLKVKKDWGQILGDSEENKLLHRVFKYNKAYVDFIAPGQKSKYKYEILRFFRNAIEHLRDNKTKTKTKPLLESDVVKIIMLTYPSVASHWQYALAKYQVLERVMMHEKNEKVEEFEDEHEKNEEVEEFENEVEQEEDEDEDVTG